MPGKPLLRRFSRLALILCALVGFADDAEAQVYVAYRGAGIINKYDADSGALIAERFIQGLTEPRAVCLEGGALYVLQSNGNIGKYDAQTGAVINDHFISSLQMPQGMAVGDGAVYVSSQAWPFQQNLRPGGSILIGKYDASTGACIKAALIQTDHFVDSLAVAGHDLFLADGAMNPNGPAVFDTTTGAPITRRYQPMLNSANFVTASDDWIWFTAGPGSQRGVIYKYSATGDATGVEGATIAYFLPLVRNINSPSFLAVSGEELFVATGSGTGISKYNATTGDLIKADFITDRGDHPGGIAVVPRAASGQYAVADAESAINGALKDSLFWASVNGPTLYLGSAILVLVAFVGFMLVWYYSRPEPAPDAGDPSASAGEPVVAAETAPEAVADSAQVAETPAVEPPAPAGPSFLGMALLGLVVVTLICAGTLAWYASQAVDITHPQSDHTPDLVGLWGIEPEGGEGNSPPVFREVYIYPTHLEYSGGHGNIRLDGQWRNDGFWYTKPDGSGEVEVCHLQDPLNLLLHLSTFASGDQGDAVLYKQRGSDAELQAVRDKYPQKLTYPPPAGVIKYWMSEYDLLNLPWHADRIEVSWNEPAYSRGKTYVYHSDNPQIPELRVTVKIHRVTNIEGGNG